MNQTGIDGIYSGEQPPKIQRQSSLCLTYRNVSVGSMEEKQTLCSDCAWTHSYEERVFIPSHTITRGDIVTRLSTLTSPFLTVMDCLRGVISSLILDRKFWEMRRASCNSGWSGWLEGVCFRRSWNRKNVDKFNPQNSLCVAPDFFQAYWLTCRTSVLRVTLSTGL